MSDEKPTQQIDQIAILRGMMQKSIEVGERGVSAAEAAKEIAETAREEGNQRSAHVDAAFRRMETNQHLLHNEVVRRVATVDAKVEAVKGELEDVKGDLGEVRRVVNAHDGAIKKLTDADVQLTQHVTGADFSREADMAAVIIRQHESDAARIAHEDAMKEALTEHEKEVAAALRAQENVLRVFSADMGIDFDAAAANGNSVPPAAEGAAPPKPTTLKRILGENRKAGLYLGAFMLVLEVLREAIKAFAASHH